LEEIGEKVRIKLETGKENAVAAKKLIALDTTIDLDVVLSDLKYQPDMETAIAEFEQLGFGSIVGKLRREKVLEVSKVENSSEDSNQLDLI